MSSRLAQRRRGLATMEVALVLPIVGLVLITMFSVAAVVFAHLDVAGVARYRAWSGRHQPWQPSDHYQTADLGLGLPDGFDRIVGDTSRVSPTAVLHAEVETEALICSLDPIFAPFHLVQGEHYTMGGSWDFHEIVFERENQHPRLHATRKFQCFTKRFVSFAPFHGLSGFVSDATAAGIERARAEHGDQDNRQSREAQRSRHHIRESIASKEAEKADIERQLAELLGAEPPDQDQVDQVRHSLDATIGQLSALYAAFDSLGKADHAHPDDPYMAPRPTRADETVRRDNLCPPRTSNGNL